MSRSDREGKNYLSMGEMSRSDREGKNYLSLGEMSRSDREGIININNTLSRHFVPPSPEGGRLTPSPGTSCHPPPREVD